MMDSKEISGGQQKARVAVGLVHWPVMDRSGEEVCTNITNFDIHDIARACRTYGVEKYYIINRMQEQLMFASRMLDHWKTGYGLRYNPMRATALGMVELSETLQEAVRDFDPQAQVMATAARDFKSHPRLSFLELRQTLQAQEIQSLFLVFGTGFGLSEQILEMSDGLLEPIRGASSDDYRHLSVRSAVSICLDRLLGAW